MDDLIKRQDAINELSYCQTYLFDTLDRDPKISLEDAKYAIEQLPSAQKKGHWIFKREEHSTYTVEQAVCSECGESCATYGLDKPRDRFCKWCGADMRGDADG